MKPLKSGTAPIRRTPFGLIRPRPHVGLEQLHHRPHQVEEDNHPELTDGFEPRGNHQDLDHDGGEGQEIVPGQCGVVGIPEARRQDHGEERGAEDAGPGLLEAEDGKLHEP